MSASPSGVLFDQRIVLLRRVVAADPLDEPATFDDWNAARYDGEDQVATIAGRVRASGAVEQPGIADDGPVRLAGTLWTVHTDVRAGDRVREGDGTVWNVRGVRDVPTGRFTVADLVRVEP